MRTRARFSRLMISALAIAAAVLTFAAAGATAQIVWNPPCPNLTVVNNTGCVIGICPAWAPALFPPCTPFMAPFPGPGNVVVIPTGPPVLNLNGLISMGGAVYPFIPLFGPPPPPPAATATLFVPNFMTGPAPGCCVDVWLDPAACTMWVFPARPAPPCRP